MEKIIMVFGFCIVVISFFLCVCVGMQFAWGVLAGLVPTGVGYFFTDP